MPLDDLIKQKLGGLTRPVENPNGVTSVGTSVVQILPNDPNRLAFTVINLSTNQLFIAPSRDVSSSKGIRIAPSGGGVVFTWEEDFHVVGFEWFAVADGAGSAIYTLAEVEYA